MANVIRIKRRASGASGAPASLENAELAFNEVDNTLYYGKGTGGAGGSATTIEVIGGLGAFVGLTTNQTIGGTKTFSNITYSATPLTADSSTQIATTAFVKAQGYSTTTGTVTNVSALTLGTSGTDVSSSVATGTTTPVITLNIPTASATNRGVLSSADWTTFNNKQPAGAYLTTAVTSFSAGTTGLTPNTGTTGAVTLGGTLAIANGGTGATTAAGALTNLGAYAATNPSGYTSNTGTVTSVAALTLGTTGTDLSSSVATNTTTPVITLNIPTASATNRGVLSSADWTTFNNKQPAGSYLTAEADTLATTTARGATTSAALTFSGGVSMGSTKISNLADPTLAQDAATKAYVDATRQGLAVKDAVRAATTANITLSGTQTVDGVAVVAGNRVLVKDQTTASQNGLYAVAAGAWTRTEDADGNTELVGGDFVFVQEGTVNADTGWVCTTDGTVTLGTTALTFTQFSGAGSILAGTGLSKTGNTLNVSLVPVANGGTGVTTSTGSGSVVLNTSPSLVTPALGTPASGNFTTGTFSWPTFNQNTTGTAAGLSATLAVASGGTGVTTSTGTGSVVLNTSPSLVTPALGTPASGNFSTGTFTWPTFNQNTTGTAAGLSATLAVSSGGTGATTLTGILKGNGTGAFTAATAGTDYLSNASTIDGGTY